MNVRQYVHAVEFVLLLLLLSPPSLVCAYTLPFHGFPKIEINGNSNLALNYNQVNGSQTVYNDDYLDTNRSFSHRSNLYITGELLHDLYLNATLVDDRFSPDNTRWSLRYDGSMAKVLLGDFTANLAGNEFVLLNRSLRGLQVDSGYRGGLFTFITCELKAPVRTQTFPGSNTSGPYYLEATPILDGSEVVAINGERKERTRDYTLDYTNGILNFTAGIIVSPSDTVTVSYEVNGSGLRGGQLYAVRASYPVRHNLTIGASYLTLTASGAQSTTRKWTEQYLGNGTRGPFYLNNRPIVSQSDVVSINGILQARETQYTLDYTTGGILFAIGAEPPQDSTITVTYQQQLASAVSNDQAVTGLDMEWKPGAHLDFTLQSATSKPTVDTMDKPGRDALAVTGAYTSRQFTASANYRAVDEGFTPLDMVGYQQALHAVDWSLQYRPLRVLTFALTGSNSREPNVYTLGSTNKIYMNARNRSYAVTFQQADWPTVAFRHTTASALQDSGSEGYHSAATTDACNVRYSYRAISVGAALNRSATDSVTPQTSSTATGFAYRGTTTTASANLAFQPGSRLNLSGVVAMNQVENNNTAATTHGTSLQLNGSYRLTTAITLTSTYTDTTTAATKDTQGSAVPAVESRSFTSGVDWRLGKNLNVGVNYSQDRSTGSGYSNSQGHTVSTNALWQPLTYLTLNGSWYRQLLGYTDTVGSTENNMLSSSAILGPLAKCTLTLDAQHIWGSNAVGVTRLYQTAGLAQRAVRTDTATSTSETVTGNRLTTLAGKLSYAILARNALFVQGELVQSGGYPTSSRKDTYGTGWDYKVSNNLTLTVSGERVKYTDYANSGLSYAATQGNAQLNWAF